MKKKFLSVMAALTLVLSLLSGCGADSSADTSGSADTGSASSQVASASEMVKPEQVVEDDMEPVPGSDVKDGVYQVTVDSSSSMFNITSCELTVQNGNMTAVMTMGGTGYLYVFMGTGEEAAQAQQSSYIPFEENEKGEHTFTVPVEALDAGIDCAAFSKNKEKWYDRTLVFRADSLPADALSNNAITTPESLNLEDGTYSIDVSLEGGSGRASVESPATLTVADGNVTAKIIWSSANYDYMKVDGTQFNCLNTGGNSTFEIPVTGFDYKMPVSADTTAMSTPHEIEYTLYFDSSTLQKK